MPFSLTPTTALADDRVGAGSGHNGGERRMCPPRRVVGRDHVVVGHQNDLGTGIPARPVKQQRVPVDDIGGECGVRQWVELLE